MSEKTNSYIVCIRILKHKLNCLLYPHSGVRLCKIVAHNNGHREAYVFHSVTAPSGPRPPHCRGFTITFRHATIGRTPLDERSARRTDLYLTDCTHNIHKREISMPRRDSNSQSQQRAAADPHLRPRGHLPSLNMNEYRPVGEILMMGENGSTVSEIFCKCHLFHHESHKDFLGIEPGTPRYSATDGPLKLRRHRSFLSNLNVDSFGCPCDGHIRSRQYPTVTHVDQSCSRLNMLYILYIHVTARRCRFLFKNQPDALIIQIYSFTKLYMFRATHLPIIRSFLLYIRHW